MEGIDRKTFQRHISEMMLACNCHMGHLLGSDPTEFGNMRETNTVI